jgi:tRNA(fMet)-specific endonuclease VapC
MYLLDTDTCIHLARGNPAVLAKLRQHRRADIHVAILTIYELELGIHKATLQKPKKRQALANLIDLFGIAPLDHPAACEAAKLRAELEKAGTPIGSIDYLIAGIARANGWTLVTGNWNEFRRVKRLKVETWHA